MEIIVLMLSTVYQNCQQCDVIRPFMLWMATGNQLAREGRAYNNAGYAGLTFWTPVIK